MAGGVSLCGSGGDLWAVEGGNWQIPEGLIRYTNASLHLKSRVVSVTLEDSGYIVELESGGTKACDTVILATSLDESKIEINPKVKLPQRSMQHTYTTFIRGLLNAVFPLVPSDQLLCFFPLYPGGSQFITSSSSAFVLMLDMWR